MEKVFKKEKEKLIMADKYNPQSLKEFEEELKGRWKRRRCKYVDIL